MLAKILHNELGIICSSGPMHFASARTVLDISPAISFFFSLSPGLAFPPLDGEFVACLETDHIVRAAVMG